MKIAGRNIVGRFALAAVAAASLVFAASAPAGADVVPHKHCLLTPSGWVLIAEGVSEEAPNDPALENFHYEVHIGEPGREHVRIVRIDVDKDCSELPVPPA
jgi:hypothetical protein